MILTDNPGRVAGLIYLLLGSSMFRPIYIANTLIVRENAIVTAKNIATHESLFHLGIVSDLLSGIACIFLALALYQVLNGVDHKLGVLMVILGGLMPAVIDFLNALNDIAALLLARGEDFLSVFEEPQRAALAMLFLRVHDHGFLVNEIFAGLWLFPFGVLVFRSVFLPRLLGVGLIINGFAYLVISFTGLLLPNYVDRVSKDRHPSLHWRRSDHAVAPDQGSQPATVRHRSQIPGGWLRCIGDEHSGIRRRVALAWCPACGWLESRNDGCEPGLWAEREVGSGAGTHRWKQS